MLPKLSPIYQLISLDITSNCNLRCPFCVNDFSIIKGNNFMSKEVFEKALTMLPLIRKDGTFLFSCVFEPTLHPRFLEYINMVPHIEGVRTSLTTNLARPLSDSYLEELSRSKLTYINVSLDSLKPDVFESLRKRAKYDVFMDNLERMVRIFREREVVPKLRYITVLSKSNIEEATSLLETTAEKYLAVAHEFRMFWLRTGQDEKWVKENILTWDDLLRTEKQLKQLPYPFMFSPFEPEAFTFLDNSKQAVPLIVPKTLSVFSDGTVNLDVVPDVYRKQDISFNLNTIEDAFGFFENIGIILNSMERKEFQNQMQQNNILFDLVGISGKNWLSRLKQEHLDTYHWIDSVNEQVIPGNGVMYVDTRDVINIVGWAVDSAAGKTAGGVIVMIDDKMFLALYGFARDDVAVALSQPQYRNSGFTATIPKSALDNSIHTLTIYILSNDRKSYFAPTRQIKFSIRENV